MKNLIAFSALVLAAAAQSSTCSTTTVSNLLSNYMNLYNLCNGEPCVYDSNCFGYQCNGAPTSQQISDYFLGTSTSLPTGTCGDYSDEAAAAVGMAVGLVIFIWVLGIVCCLSIIGLIIYCCVRANRQKLQVQLIQHQQPGMQYQPMPQYNQQQPTLQ